MNNTNNSAIVAKAAGISFFIAWALLISSAILIFTGLFDLQIVLWRVYAGVITIGFSTFAFALYAILKALEPITMASEVYLDSETEEVEC